MFQVCFKNPDDDLPRHRPPRLHGLALDHSLLDPQTVREVGTGTELLKPMLCNSFKVSE